MTPSPFAQHMHAAFDVAHALARGEAGDAGRLSEALCGMAEEYAALMRKYTAFLDRHTRRLRHDIALADDRLPLRWDCCLDLDVEVGDI